MPRRSNFATIVAELRKKLVKSKQFGKINAIRPEIKARRGRKKKFNLGQKANWGGLVKELGFLSGLGFAACLSKNPRIVKSNEVC